MASDYPGGLDSFDAIAADKKTSDAVGGRTHRAMHNDLGDAIEAVQTELGANPSGSEATVKARFEVIEANDWVTAARIAADAVGSSELADSAVTPVKLARPIGNLLTDNQALPATVGGWSLDGVTESSAGFYTATGTGVGKALATGFPVDANETYTATANLSPTGRTCKMVLEFRTAGGANTGGWLSANEISSGASGYSTITTVAPADAATVVVYPVYTGSGAPGDTVSVWRTGLWRGAGGDWQKPGVPITNTGIRPNPSNTSEVQVWNSATATWITV